MAAFPALNKIWDDQYCQKCDVGGIAGRECLCCGEKFKSVHHTHAVAHYAKIPNCGIQVCTAAIPEMEFKQYVNLRSASCKRKTELTMVKMTITEEKEEGLNTASKQLFNDSNKKPRALSELKQYFKSEGLSKSTIPLVSLPLLLPLTI